MRRDFNGRNRRRYPTILNDRARRFRARTSVAKTQSLTPPAPRGRLPANLMTTRTFATAVRSLAAACLLPLLGGCVHESYTYRAVPNVNVARAQDLGSAGP